MVDSTRMSLRSLLHRSNRKVDLVYRIEAGRPFTLSWPGGSLEEPVMCFANYFSVELQIRVQVHIFHKTISISFISYYAKYHIFLH